MRELLAFETGTRFKVLAALEECYTKNLDVLVYCTFRPFAEQAAEYAKGRTVPNNGTAKNPMGSIVTKARPGWSWHQWGRAIDLVPRRNGKTLVWGTRGNGLDQDPSDDLTDELELWQRVAIVFKSHGLQWGGDFVTMKDFPHFQDPGPWTLKQLNDLYPKGLRPGAFV
jgi:peptidoglycan L-alanyl-D-glutamate endopeptidase CwlK